MRPRNGKSLPESVTSGIDIAAASDTIPRIPVHPTTKISRGFNSTSSVCPSHRRSTYDAIFIAGYTQIIRNPINTALNTTP